MWRRFAFTLVGVLAGYLIGTVAGMVVFVTANGTRSTAIYEESNRNRWVFIAAAGAAVLGGLVGWWRSYAVAGADATDAAMPADAAVTDDAMGGQEDDETAPDVPVDDAPPDDEAAEAPDEAHVVAREAAPSGNEDDASQVAADNRGDRTGS